MRYLLILSLLVIPLTPAFGYEYFETFGWLGVDQDPTVCLVDLKEHDLNKYEIATKEAVNQWSSSLKEYTNNDSSWNIDYRLIDGDKGITSGECEIFIFVRELDEITAGQTGKSENDLTVIEINPNTTNNLSILIQHEIGHALGLGHYITNQDNLIEQWEQGNTIPSIMIQGNNDFKEITSLDLEKIVSIYGNDGFEKNRIVPDWVRNISLYWSQELISDNEYLDAIQYLVSKGIIQV